MTALQSGRWAPAGAHPSQRNDTRRDMPDQERSGDTCCLPMRLCMQILLGLASSLLYAAIALPAWAHFLPNVNFAVPCYIQCCRRTCSVRKAAFRVSLKYREVGEGRLQEQLSK